MNNLFRGMVFILAIAVLPGGHAQAQVVGCPDWELSIIVQDIQADTALLVIPDGSGPPLTEARHYSGTMADATIYLTLYSSCPPTGPMVGYPAEDMWLESTEGSLVFCSGGSIADAPTDDQGSTTWSRPLAGGGQDTGTCVIRISGGDSPSLFSFPLQFNSPDLNADLMVNLTDVVEFAEDFFDADYEFRSDLHFDFVVNLSDLSEMAGAIGTACP